MYIIWTQGTMIMDLDQYTPEQLAEALAKKASGDALELTRKAMGKQKNAKADQFVNDMVQKLIDDGLGKEWSRVLGRMKDYQPSDDKQAKALGYTYKGKNPKGETTYFLRKVQGAKAL